MTTTATPYLCVKDAPRALDFYAKAFGAKETMRLKDPKDGRIGHAEIEIGEALIMLADEFPDFGVRSPQSIGGSPVTIVLRVPDVDVTARQAVTAGMKTLVPVQDQFYGERSGRFEDPFGHVWIISTHKEDVSAAEMQRRYDALAQR